MIIISEYGIKIKNIEAATLYEYNLGLRDHYDYKDAMLTNSLFKDFLVENGLDIYKEESTRDIICIEFNFGTRDFDQEIKHLNKLIKKYEDNLQEEDLEEKTVLKINAKLEKINALKEKAISNESKYEKVTKDRLRENFYVNGVNVPYIYRKKDGTIKKVETLHYKRLFRSTGKAKKGTCMFIREELFDKADDYLRMGITLPETNAPIVEINAYEPLIASGIVGKIKINPRNILVLKDIESFMTRDVISIETDESRHCHGIKRENYTLKNTLFDGQALIDSSIFPEWGDGYILLRQHFCKMAAFCTHIQKFFKDYYGEEYETATVKDLWGNIHYIKNIELITTDNAMKWLKWPEITYDYWCKKVEENGSLFGIVKTAHESKFKDIGGMGNVQKMSYQMINSLDEDVMDNVLSKSKEYVEKLKSDTNTFLEYLKKKSNFSNDHEVLLSLVEQNPEFVRSDYFRQRRKKIINTYVLNLKNGEVLNTADNLVIVGSPYAMLLYGATGDPNIIEQDKTFNIEEGTIQCYTSDFNDGEYLAFFRSPFNSKNNLTYLHNTYSEIWDKYFDLGRLCIAINMIGTDTQDRNNGSDQDSDSGYTTNQPDIVECARRYYIEYPTIVNNIPKDKNMYNNTMLEYARLDNMLSASQTDIGESSNLAQLAQSYACNFDDPKYQEYVCILSVIAQAAIDSAKRLFDINISDEIKRIKKDMDIDKHKYPSFWLAIKKDFNKDNINSELHCPMNSLYNIKFRNFRDKESTLPISYFFKKFDNKPAKKTCKKVEELITEYSFDLNNYVKENESDNIEQYLLLRSDFEDIVEKISKMNISSRYLGLYSWLIDRAFLIAPGVIRNNNTIQSKLHKNKSLLLKILYEVNKDNLLKCFSNGLNPEKTVTT